MVAFYPEIGQQALPSDFLLQRMNRPGLSRDVSADDLRGAPREWHAAACTRSTSESLTHIDLGTKASCRNARVSRSPGACCWSRSFLADRFGLVMLIARGYRALAYIILAIYVLPLLTYGVWRLARPARPNQ